jgi:hypothetical protein
LIWIWSADQVFGGHAKAARRHLLDRSAGCRRPAAAVDLDHVLADHRGQRLALLDGDALELVAVARGSSPPSPVLLLPPMRFMATASVAWASVEMEPSDMAPVAKRLTISLAGSTSSREWPCRIELELEQAAQRHGACSGR